MGKSPPFLLLLSLFFAIHALPPRSRPLIKTRSTFPIRKTHCLSSSCPSLFKGQTDRLPPHELQRFLRNDIQRRYTELILLGWLGRIYGVIPLLFDRYWPELFELRPYSSTAAACFYTNSSTDGVAVYCVLKEGSVGGPKGIPFHLTLRITPQLLPLQQLPLSSQPAWQSCHVECVELRSIGCDLMGHSPEEGPAAAGGDGETSWKRMGDSEVSDLCASMSRAENKRVVVAAITRTIFSRLSPVGDAVRRGSQLEAWRGSGECEGRAAGDDSGLGARLFEPRQQVFGLEGSSKKWLQEVSGYYFAASILQDVAFANGDAPGVVFTFYLDPTEPLNADDPACIYNPEVVNCSFMGVG